MTTAKPHKASPLALISHRFTDVTVKAAAEGRDGGRFSLATNRKLARHADNPRMFLLELTVGVGASDESRPPAYEARLLIEGEFEVAEQYPLEKAPELVHITGASMLYGACREMLANITARSTHGMVTLPSISFHNDPTPTTKPKPGLPVAKKKIKAGK